VGLFYDVPELTRGRPVGSQADAQSHELVRATSVASVSD